MTNDERARENETQTAPGDAKHKDRQKDLSVTKESLKDLSITGDAGGSVKGGIPKLTNE